MDPKTYFIMLSMVEGLGPRLTSALLRVFGSPERIWDAGEEELRQVSKLPERVVRSLITKRVSLDPEREIKKLSQYGVNAVYIDEPDYPPLLKHIFDPPRILYVRGNISVLQLPMLGIVGARKASPCGLAVAEGIARGLAENGICVVSGMARGIDSAAHRGALGVSAPTVAVLGCGVDVVYPRENRYMMEEIIKNGAVISEFPPGTRPVPGNFPQRNRIISGVSRGILVVEAAEKSGSLITADFALEQGREVFAVPGQVTNKLNRGAHRLIKQGARLVEDPADILEELGMQLSAEIPADDRDKETKLSDLTGSQRKIYNIISDDPVSIETIIIETGLRAEEVISTLLEIELKGLVTQLAGERYIRSI